MSEIDFLDITTATEQQGSYIKVIGVGGAGTNAVNHMYRKGITGVDFIVCNTDKQSLEASPVITKIKLGDKDLGAGNNPEVGQKAAVAASDKIKAVLSKNTHMLFIAAGMGGGTGTGASSEIAKIAKEIEVEDGNDEILVVAVVTIPFSFEGKKRRDQAIAGIENLKKVVDSVIIVNTDKLKGRGNMLMSNAFAMADDVLLTAAKGISEIMTANAYIHVDFRDVQSVMQHSGVALMGSGEGEGEDRAYEAIQAATTSDLLNDNDLKETKNILLYVSFSSKEEYQLQMDELETITNYIEELTSPDVDKIWGYGYDDSLEGKIAITLVATGFEPKPIYHSGKRDPEIKQQETITETIHQIPVIENTIEVESNSNNIENTPKINIVEERKDIPTYDKSSTDTNGFTITEHKEIESQTTTMLETQAVVTKIALGETINETEEIAESVQENQELESKEDIMAQFAKMESKTPSIMIPEVEEEITSFEKPAVSSLFAPSVNKEMDQIFHTTENTEQKKPTLKDTLNSSNFQTEASSQGTFTVQEATETKKERIKRINELLKAGKSDFIESIHPAVDDIDEKLSMMSNSETRMGVSKDGTLTIMENPIIGSGVD